MAAPGGRRARPEFDRAFDPTVRRRRARANRPIGINARSNSWRRPSTTPVQPFVKPPRLTLQIRHERAQARARSVRGPLAGRVILDCPAGTRIERILGSSAEIDDLGDGPIQSDAGLSEPIACTCETPATLVAQIQPRRRTGAGDHHGSCCGSSNWSCAFTGSAVR